MGFFLAALCRPTRSIPTGVAVALLLAACGANPTGGDTIPAATPSAATPSVTTTSSAAPSTTTAPTTTAAPAATTAPAAGTTLRLTIVYDNTAHDPRLAPAWGFATLVEVPGGTLLFDTGGDGTVLLGNMDRLGIDPASIEKVVLSHEHQDHTGGLAALFDAGATPTVYLPASLSRRFKESVATRTEVIEVTGPLEILPGVFSTGEMGQGIVEQALTVRTAAGTVVLTGCAHPGIVEMVRRAREVLPGDIALVVGGFHLVEAAPGTVDGIVAAFREIGVEQVAPAHCTGEAAIAAFAREYGDGFVATGAGRVIEVG